MQDILTIMEDMCSQMHNVGNNRITVSLADGHIEEVNHYYPFGGLMGDSRNATTQPYKYIGKELDRTHGLDWYDHGARHYDPVTGRGNVMDALAEKYYPWSPYVSCLDNPIIGLDVDGCKTYLYITQLSENNSLLLSTILYKAGISKEILGNIKEKMKGITWGFGDIKPRTKEEQDKAVKDADEQEELINKIVKNANRGH